eukprot:TRINITY_DN32074_c0_g1_i1.p1 TRINITY_DN32074_c0_g1~~TRINITY_DN32074_c0_g1_i1.p1  ORF type:complete len:545 (+),score=88.14 TRINITY_DN32074_c0_g1_i1:99-1733(+)
MRRARSVDSRSGAAAFGSTNFLGLRATEADVSAALCRAVRASARYALADHAQLQDDDFSFAYRTECPWGMTAEVVAPAVFATFRRHACGISVEDWVSSWSETPGAARQCHSKRASTFIHTGDGRFMVKCIHEGEYHKAREMLRALHDHFSVYPKSLLNRPLGLLSVSNSGKEAFLVVLQNSVPPAATAVYDLKGSQHGREAGEVARNQRPPLFKDLDWLRQGTRLELNEHSAAELKAQLRVDATFLRSLDVMDYSLLASVEATPERARRAAAGSHWTVPSADGSKHYHFCMIDYFQQYTPAKRIAHAMKSFVVDGLALSSVPSPVYAARFIHFIEERVLQVVRTATQSSDGWHRPVQWSSSADFERSISPCSDVAGSVGPELCRSDALQLPPSSLPVPWPASDKPPSGWRPTQRPSLFSTPSPGGSEPPSPPRYTTLPPRARATATSYRQVFSTADTAPPSVFGESCSSFGRLQSRASSTRPPPDRAVDRVYVRPATARACGTPPSSSCILVIDCDAERHARLRKKAAELIPQQDLRNSPDGGG